MANGKYDSPDDRKRRTTTRTLSALQEQEVKYKDASASPAETRQRGKELFASKMGLPREGKSRSIDDIAGAKLKSERKRDLDRLKEIEKMQEKEEKNRAKKAGRGGGGSQAVKRGMGLTGPNPFAKRMKEGGEAVPAKFKGFSKLPENVQQKMDPDLAQKYEKGGAVGSCRGMGAAMRGGKFSGVR